MLPNLGGTRSSLKHYHLLHTPDAFIRGPLPYATGVDFILHTAPQLRAGFTWATAEFALGGILYAPSPSIERFLYLLTGRLALTSNGLTTPLAHNSYAYLPAGTEHTIVAETARPQPDPPHRVLGAPVVAEHSGPSGQVDGCVVDDQGSLDVEVGYG